jgi:hypothetical protein
MKRITIVFSLLMLAVFVSCAKRDSATAIIRVTYGDPPQVKSADEHFLDAQNAIFESVDFALHANEKFNLSKSWGLSNDQTVIKLHNSISVDAGNEPGLFVIKITGIEHELAVKILNELCDFYTKRAALGIWESNNGSQPQKINISIVSSAK